MQLPDPSISSETSFQLLLCKVSKKSFASHKEVQLLLDFINRSVVSVIKWLFLLKRSPGRRAEDQNHILRLTCEKLHFYANLCHNISSVCDKGGESRDDATQWNFVEKLVIVKRKINHILHKQLKKKYCTSVHYLLTNNKWTVVSNSKNSPDIFLGNNFDGG